MLCFSVCSLTTKSKWRIYSLNNSGKKKKNQENEIENIHNSTSIQQLFDTKIIHSLWSYLIHLLGLSKVFLIITHMLVCYASGTLDVNTSPTSPHLSLSPTLSISAPSSPTSSSSHWKVTKLSPPPGRVSMLCIT